MKNLNEAFLNVNKNEHPAKKHQEVLNRLHEVLDSYCPQSPEYYAYLDDIMQPLYIRKDTTLCQQGKVIGCAYFLSSGFMTASHYAENGDRHVVNIFSKDEIVSGKSFTDQTPSDYELVACEGAYVLYLSYADVQEIYQKFPPTQGQAMSILASKEKKELERSLMLRQQAEKLVADFYAAFPELGEPGKILIDADIASYLMISESTLREHRSKLMKKAGLNSEDKQA